MNQSSNQTAHQNVAVMTAVYLRLPQGSDAADKALHRVVREIEKRLQVPFKVPDADAIPSNSFSVVWLDEPHVNAGRCQRCQRWTTDLTLPEGLRGTLDGRRIGKGYICFECEAILAGEQPNSDEGRETKKG